MGDTDDFITALHLIGPAADLTLHRDRLSLRLATDVLPDFAMVRPFALDPARGSDQLVGQKSTVRHHAYYYALGVTTTARAEAQYRKLRAGAGLSYSYYDSIEGLDRHQTDYVSPTGVLHPAISDDAEAVDQRLTLRLFGDSALPATDMRLGVSLDYRQRTGTMSQTTREQDDLRLLAAGQLRAVAHGPSGGGRRRAGRRTSGSPCRGRARAADRPAIPRRRGCGDPGRWPASARSRRPRAGRSRPGCSRSGSGRGAGPP